MQMYVNLTSRWIMSGKFKQLLTIAISFSVGLLVGLGFYFHDSVIPAMQAIYQPHSEDALVEKALTLQIPQSISSQTAQSISSQSVSLQPVKTIPLTNLSQQQDNANDKRAGEFHDYTYHRAHLPRHPNFSSTQLVRKNTLNQFCKGKHRLNRKSPRSIIGGIDFSHVLVNDRSGVLFCIVPKVASTNWKRTFLGIDDRHRNKNLADITGSQIHDMMKTPNLNDRSQRTKTVLKDFYKFLYVRHPFERLASCYRDKFVIFDKSGRERPYYMLVYGSQILSLYRKGLSREEIKKGFGVTFLEFARWLIEKKVRNEHWDPMFDICQPCLIEYDFIGDMSSLRKDAAETLHHIGLKDASNFEHKMSQTAIQGFKISSRQLAKQLFAELDQKLIDALYKRYEKDFLAFGFTKEL